VPKGSATFSAFSVLWAYNATKVGIPAANPAMGTAIAPKMEAAVEAPIIPNPRESKEVAVAVTSKTRVVVMEARSGVDEVD
jgi:hypothetical protein